MSFLPEQTVQHNAAIILADGKNPGLKRVGEILGPEQGLLVDNRPRLSFKTRPG